MSQEKVLDQDSEIQGESPALSGNFHEQPALAVRQGFSATADLNLGKRKTLLTAVAPVVSPRPAPAHLFHSCMPSSSL